jgi:hypothetical protein
MTLRKALIRVLTITVVFVGLTIHAHADLIVGNMYYTTFSGGTDVHKVQYSYNPGVSFTLTNNTGLASTPGADGIVFTSDGQLAVGGQGPSVYRVNPTSGSFTSQTTGPGGLAAYHMTETSSPPASRAGRCCLIAP